VLVTIGKARLIEHLVQVPDISVHGADLQP
jgi:hypothetical protein